MKRVVSGLAVALSVALTVVACTGDAPATVIVTGAPDGGSPSPDATPGGDPAVDAGTCTSTVYPIRDANAVSVAEGFLSSAPQDGTIRRDSSGIVFESAADQTAVLTAQVLDRASIVRFTVRGEVTLRESGVALAPVGVYIGDLGTTVGHVDLVRAPEGTPGVFYGDHNDTAEQPLAAGAARSFPADIEVPFELVFRGRWKYGPTVELRVGGQPGATGKVAGYEPQSNDGQALNIAVGVASVQPTATTVRLHALAVEVCRE